MRELAQENRHMFVPETRPNDYGETMQRIRYGGLRLGSVFFGWLAANSVVVLLVSLVTALGGAVALTTNTNRSAALVGNAGTVGLVGALLLLAILAVAYYSGGYVAGRMARFDGPRQGLGVWVLGIVATVALAIAGGILGSRFNVFQQLNLPNLPVDGYVFTRAGLVTFIASIAITAGAGVAGGDAGERYHHRVDAAAGHIYG